MNPNAQTAIIEINAPIEKIWQLWTSPADIMQWNNLSADWHTTHVENDLRAGGRFLFAMGLKDGSFSFNFEGTYTKVVLHELITYTLDDGRKSINIFSNGAPVKITETFEPQNAEPPEVQLAYCQAVLTSFKNYAEQS